MVNKMMNGTKAGGRTLVGAKGMVLTAFLLVVLLVGCRSEGPTETLEERAQARWDLVLARDFEAAWEYLTPGYRQTTNRFDYARDMAGRPLRLLSAEVVGTECEEDLCKINVLVGYRAVGAPAGMGQMRLSREIEETWIWLDGAWWFVQN